MVIWAMVGFLLGLSIGMIVHERWAKEEIKQIKDRIRKERAAASAMYWSEYRDGYMNALGRVGEIINEFDK